MDNLSKEILEVLSEQKRKVLQLDRFPGNLAEYCALKGKEFEIIDTGNPEQYITERNLSSAAADYWAHFDSLVEKSGLVGLIHYVRVIESIPSVGLSDHKSYGIPVRLKRDKVVKP